MNLRTESALSNFGQQCTTVVGGIPPFLNRRAAPVSWASLVAVLGKPVLRVQG